MEVAESMDELEATVACITFAEPRLLRGFERKMELPYPIYGDPERAAYRAFGFPRASNARVWLDPRVLRRYASLLLRGRRPGGAPRQDELQLGGDVVLDGEGRVAWVYRSKGPEDRPSVERLREVIDEAKAGARAA
ncbi:hypothetical protein BH20ACT18_BH20ACT18_01560 [soil metagenome]